ncbi:MAG: NAD(P)H-quinone oxidoreductase [Rhodobacteraceae bacterium]|nr:NAD(P)H-quinone oxidoreductase [Paracoccaceae bacterium]
MRAIEIRGFGGPEVLVPGERPVPAPGAGEILVRVAAAGVNRPDVAQRQGVYPPPPGASDIPGLEIAGEVVACGRGVTRWQPGEQVAALVTGGGYAEFCLAHEEHALPVPASLSATEAAAIPETLFTVWHNVVERGRLRAGEWLLVHGGASGIGTMAIQLGRARGARVIVTAGSPARCAACLALGAERAVDHRSEDFVAAVREATGGHGADVILDMVGGSYLARNLDAAAVEGRIAQIAMLGGAKAEIPLFMLMVKRLTLTGSTLRPRSVADKAAMARAIAVEVWPLVAQGRIRPVIDRVLPLAEAAEAHRHMESGSHVGKIVLSCG